MHTDINKNNERGSFHDAEELQFHPVDEDRVLKPEVHLPAKPIENFEFQPLQKREMIFRRAVSIFSTGFVSAGYVSIWFFSRAIPVGMIGVATYAIMGALIEGAKTAIPAMGAAIKSAFIFVTEVVGYGVGLIVAVLIVALIIREIVGIMPGGSDSGDYSSSGGKDSFNINIHNEINIKR